MTLKHFLMIGFVAAALVACGDDDSSGFATRPSGDSSSACEDCDDSSSSKSKSSSSSSVTPKSSDSETSVSSSSVTITDGSEYDADNNTLTDLRDSTVYKTVTIGTQIWMAENLNYAYIGIPYNYSGYTFDSTSWCYGDNPANCTKYGRLYTWAAAMDSVGTWSTNSKGCGYGTTCSPTYPVRGICPEGWHLPDTTEWNALFAAVGGEATAGTMLKSTEGWNDYEGTSGNGSDAYAFSALPAGRRYSSGDFSHEGYNAYFWSSSGNGSDFAYRMCLYYDYDDADLSNVSKFNGFSVRCLKDSE